MANIKEESIEDPEDNEEQNAVVGSLHASQVAHVLLCLPIYCQLVLCLPIYCQLVFCTWCTLPTERMHAGTLPVRICQSVGCQYVVNPPVFCLLTYCQPVLCLLIECTLVHCMRYFASQYLAYRCKTRQYLANWYFDCDVLCPRVVCQLYFAHGDLPACTLPTCSLHIRYIAFWYITSQYFAYM